MYRSSDYGFVMDVRRGSSLLAYSFWINMANRCYNRNKKDYIHYGGRGVYVCEEWKLFSNFKRWFDENYIEDYQLDKDLNGLGYYGPDSCVFVSRADNVAEANSRRDYGSISGENNKHSIDIKQYETKKTRRSAFKTTCSTRGWNFDDFEEVFADWHIYPCGTKRVREYFYKKIAK